LWLGGVKDGLIKHAEPEKTVVRSDKTTGLNRAISNISEPTVTPYPAPKDKATGAAVVIFPGGAFRRVAIDHEGHDVARKLNERGVAAVVVKYRTMPVDPNGKVHWARSGHLFPAIVADGRRAVRLARSRAVELNADPNKIGVMGFSAGGALAISVMLDAEAANSGLDDKVEKESYRPDFACLLYPAVPDEALSNIKPGVCPCFIAVSSNDRSVGVEKPGKLFLSLREAGVPAELHGFQSGGHGYGLGRTTGTESMWFDMFSIWLKQNGFER